LLGALPEFDSMAVVILLGAMEESFDVEFADDEITAEAFESIGTLTAFVQAKL
jgi:acyl carrier protein